MSDAASGDEGLDRIGIGVEDEAPRDAFRIADQLRRDLTNASFSVWIGAASLAVGGMMLLNYVIEAGLLTSGAKVAFGSIVAVGLAIGGMMAPRGRPSPNLGIVLGDFLLSLAAAVSLMTACYARSTGVADPLTVAFAISAVAAAVVLSGLVAGRAVVAAGLAIGLAGPWVAGVQALAANPWLVLASASAPAAAAMLVARMRDWGEVQVWAGCVAFGGASLYSGAIGRSPGAAEAIVIHAAALGAAFAALRAPTSAREGLDPWGCAVLGTAAVSAVAGLSLGAGGIGLVAFAAMMAGYVALAARTPAFAPLAPVSALLTAAGVLAVRFVDYLPRTMVREAMTPFARGQAWGEGPATRVGKTVGQTSDSMYGSTAFDFGSAVTSKTAMIGLDLTSVGVMVALLLFVANHFAAKTRPSSPSWWSVCHAAAAAFGPTAILAAVHWRASQFDPSWGFAAAAFAISAALCWLIDDFKAEDGEESPMRSTYAAGAVGAACVGLAMLTGASNMHVLMAFAVVALGAVSLVRPAPAIGAAAIALAIVSVLMSGLAPVGLGHVSSTPIWNALLWLHGAPALALLAGAVLFALSGDQRASRVAGWSALLFSASFGFLEAHHIATEGYLFSGKAFFVAGYAATWAFALACLVGSTAGRREGHAASASVALAVAGAAGSLFVLGVVLLHAMVGRGVPLDFGDLTGALLLPAVGCMLASRFSAHSRYKGGAGEASWRRGFLSLGAAMAALWVWVGLGSVFGPGSYTAVLAREILMFGVSGMILLQGSLLGSRRMRGAAFVVASLSGLVAVYVLTGSSSTPWRAAALLALGASLVLMGKEFSRVASAEAEQRSTTPSTVSVAVAFGAPLIALMLLTIVAISHGPGPSRDDGVGHQGRSRTIGSTQG